MAIRIHCDKCGLDLGAVSLLAYGEMAPAPGTDIPLITATVTKPPANYNVVPMPDGNRKVLCDACKAAFEALVAGF